MPANAFALLGFFVLLALFAGVVAVRLVGPRSVLAVLVPAAAALIALETVGHRLGLVVGPQVRLFGFDVSLPFDVAVAFAAALVGALVQRAVLGAREGGRGTAA
jgi:hypothetical protein